MFAPSSLDFSLQETYNFDAFSFNLVMLEIPNEVEF